MLRTALGEIWPGNLPDRQPAGAACIVMASALPAEAGKRGKTGMKTENWDSQNPRYML